MGNSIKIFKEVQYDDECSREGCYGVPTVRIWSIDKQHSTGGWHQFCKVHGKQMKEASENSFVKGEIELPELNIRWTDVKIVDI